MKWKTVKNKFPEVTKELQALDGKSVQVGVMEGEHQWLAAIHEYGCTVNAVNAEYLTVPVHPAAKGKRAADFDDLFAITSKAGNKFLARKRGKDDLELIFWLTKSVKIPERSFLRAGYNDCINDVMKHADLLLKQVAGGSMSADNMLDMIGQQLATKIKKFARDLDSPANSGAATETKGSTNPLVDTGGMINGITWKVK